MIGRQKRIGVMGAGRIGQEVVAHLKAAPGWVLVRVYSRNPVHTAVGPTCTDIDAFLGHDLDLVLDLASPALLAEHGPRALAVAETWTVNAAALADPAVHDRIERAARESGHRLRLLWGAMSGLDGIATASRDPEARLHLTLTRPGIRNEPGHLFTGSVREAAGLFPEETNVAVAAAMAGPGLDRSRVDIVSAGSFDGHTLTAVTESCFGRFTAEVALRPGSGMPGHPVAAAVIAALDRETRPIWAG